ncbi:hypothetical protein [Kineosporia babensis]|uniref:Uncharacterized protein n=1 Tax=Kineosporia babensis TaxID=499548 RepID=A0A9X1NB93_9ACTN|nr:hypothetical protein [Kineosporia babensis]MCD5310943.1 hypothetical protein [Kineosporia babensis]
MRVAVAVDCRARMVDESGGVHECTRSAGYLVTIAAECAPEKQREVCDSHLCALKAGAVNCEDGAHVVRLVSSQRVGGAA